MLSQFFVIMLHANAKAGITVGIKQDCKGNGDCCTVFIRRECDKDGHLCCITRKRCYVGDDCFYNPDLEEDTTDAAAAYQEALENENFVFCHTPPPKKRRRRRKGPGQSVKILTVRQLF